MEKVMREKLRQFIRDERGLTTVEYAVAGALVSAAIVAAFALLGDSIAAVITLVADNVT